MRTALAVGVVLFEWLRQRRARGDGWADSAKADQQAILDMVIAHARPQLASQLRYGDEIATKALGVLALNVSALAVLVTVGEQLNEWWWVAGAGLLLSAVLLLATIWPRAFSVGPEPAEFYAKMAGQSRRVAGRQMLTELIAALERNDAPLRAKDRLFKAGFALLVVSGFGAVGVVLAS
jgi:hypothetical protein